MRPVHLSVRRETVRTELNRMRKRFWARLAMIGGSATLLQGGCRGSLMREFDMLTSPEALRSLLFLPLSDFQNLFRFLWY